MKKFTLVFFLFMGVSFFGFSQTEQKEQSQSADVVTGIEQPKTVEKHADKKKCSPEEMKKCEQSGMSCCDKKKKRRAKAS